MTRMRYGFLAVLLGAALMLAGCGGDDGVDESMHAQVVAERDAALMAQQEAEEAAETAEERAETAEEAAETAEERAETAEEAVETAEEAVETAEEAVETAEEAVEMAEEERMKALMDVQNAAAAAEMAAKMASDAAAMDATAAAEATENIATLQTGEMSMMMAYEAKKAAAAAMMAYEAAKKAAIAADEAETIEAATEAKVMAEAAQMDAEMYAMTAMEKKDGAVKYAAMELMIDGYVKSVGDSSIDARMGRLTTPAEGDNNMMITGLLEDDDQPMRTTAMRGGRAFVQRGTPPATATADISYKQAVASGNIKIGKLLDTMDDMARLKLITHYEGDKNVRVFVDGPLDAVTDLVGAATAAVAGTSPEVGGALDDDAIATPVGLYYKAEHYSDATTAAPDDTALGAFDRVTVTDAKGEEIFKLTAEGVTNEVYARRVDSTTNVATGVTTHTYRQVDVMADASATDGPDEDGAAEDLAVKVNIPAAVKYSHLHFGVWASLDEAEKDGSQDLADLGIGFVQNFSNSGVTQKQGIGEATFNGDWAAAVQRAHGEGKGSTKLVDGKATLMANFGTDKFTGTLDGLAKLEGSLSGNGFSGMKVTVPDNEHGLTAGASFTGMFEGGIYGPDGAEAGGVFNFSSESDGAFRGAFGGHRDGNP